MIAKGNYRSPFSPLDRVASMRFVRVARFPWPAAHGLSGAFSRFRHSCSGIFRSARPHASTALPAFAPPTFTGFFARMRALTPARRGFCRALVRAGLPLFVTQPSERSVAKHPMPPRGPFSCYPSRPQVTASLPRNFALPTEARREHLAELRSSLSYGPFILLPLLPTAPRGHRSWVQIRGRRAYTPAGTSTLLIACARRRT
jgi:hypothetical protein